VRDDRTCIITKLKHIPHAAHIYPFHLTPTLDVLSMVRVGKFWGMLETFWNPERVQAWKASIFPNGGDVCSNLICMSPDAHAYWDGLRFALKPIELADDGMSMKVQFFWMPKYKFEASQDLMEMPVLPSDLDHNEVDTVLYNGETKQEVRSGDIMTITTHDPTGFPLPDMHLLQSQWVLHRLMAIRGASEESSNDDYDDDDQAPRVPSWLRRKAKEVVEDDDMDDDMEISDMSDFYDRLSWKRHREYLEEEEEEEDEEEEGVDDGNAADGEGDGLEDVPELRLDSSVAGGPSSSLPAVSMSSDPAPSDPAPADHKVAEYGAVADDGIAEEGEDVTRV
jgi:hypothetical protein